MLHGVRVEDSAPANTAPAHVEGLPQGDWVLIDAHDVVVHIFRAEVRAYYDLEGMWSVDETASRRRAVEHASPLA